MQGAGYKFARSDFLFNILILFVWAQIGLLPMLEEPQCSKIRSHAEAIKTTSNTETAATVSTAT